MDRSQFPTVTALVVTILFWASAFPAIRLALTAYTPAETALLRYITASLVIGVYAVVRRMPLPQLRDLPLLAAAGFLGFTLYNLMLNTGETAVPAGTASFIISSEVGVIALLARFFFKERLKWAGWIGVVLCLTGVAVISFGPQLSSDVSGPQDQLAAAAGVQSAADELRTQAPLVTFTFGALLVFIATLSVSIYSVMQKPILKRYTPMQFTAYAIWAGTACLFFFAPRAIGSVVGAPIGPTMAVMYMGVFPGVIAYFCWSYVLSRIPASRAGSFITMIPVAAIFISWIWLGEVPGIVSIIGGAVVLAGIVLVNKKSKARKIGGG